MTHPEQEDLLTLDEWQAFVWPYLAVQAQDDPSLARRIDLYRAIFPLFWLSLLLESGVECSAGIALADPGAVLRRNRLRSLCGHRRRWVFSFVRVLACPCRLRWTQRDGTCMLPLAAYYGGQPPLDGWRDQQGARFSCNTFDLAAPACTSHASAWAR